MMAIRKLISLVTLVVFAFACSKQGEGDRCASSNGDQDCDDGLTCQAPAGGRNECLNPTSDAIDCLPTRCCYPAPQVPTDSRCIGYSVAAPTIATGGSNAAGSSAGGNSSATGGSTSAGGTSAAGGDSSSGGTTSAGGSSTIGGTTAVGGVSSSGGTSASST